MKYILSILLIIFAVFSVFGQNIINDKTLVYENGEINFIESYLNLCLLVDSTIDKKAYYKEIDILCAEAEEEIEGYKSSEELVEKLNNYFFIQKGFKSNFEVNQLFFGSKNEVRELEKNGFNHKDLILLPMVLKNKEGICISLSLLYLTIAFKLEIPMFGVFVPNHFFVRFNDGTSKINIETTELGKQYSDEYYLQKYIGKNISKIFLEDLDVEQTIGLYLSNIGNVYLISNKFGESIEFYNLSLKIIDDAGTFYNRGLANSNKGSYGIAIEDYTKAAEINPNFTQAFMSRGIAFAKLELFDKAIKDLTIAINIDTDFAGAYYNRGVVYSKQSLFNEAIDDFNSAIQIKPDYSEAFYNRGWNYGIKGMLNEAIQDFTSAIEIVPNYQEAYINRGITYNEKGLSDLAMADFTVVIDNDPFNSIAYYNRGVAYGRKGLLIKAILEFTIAIEIDPNYSEAYSFRGLVRWDSGKKIEACADWEKALKLGDRIVQELIDKYCK